MPLKPCKSDQTRNPNTNRCIKIGGPTYNNLKKNKEYPVKKLKQCNKDQVRSPLTNRCINKNGKLYEKFKINPKRRIESLHYP